MKRDNINIITILAILLIAQIPAYSQKSIMPKEKKSKWALVQGRKKITEYRYDTIQYKYNDYFVSKLDGKWGILDIKGDEIIPFEFDGIEDLYQGILKVELADNFGVIDTSGSELCELKYLGIDNFGRDSSILVKDIGGWKYIKDGKIINKDAIVFKNPDQIAIYGNCSNLEQPEEMRKCSQDLIHDIVFKNLEYPKKAYKNGISGMVVVSFWISTNGEIIHREILKDIGAGCGASGLHVIAYLDNWNPAVKDGKAVLSEFILPIRFALK